MGTRKGGKGMKKSIILVLTMLLLTGCWDRLPLKTLQLVDIAVFDRDEENGDFVLHYMLTKLKNAGQGGGEPVSYVTKFKGPSIVEAIGKGEYSDSGPFLAINTGIYLMTKKFASKEPIDELAFLLQAPYTSINANLFVLNEGKAEDLLKNKLEANKEFVKQLYTFSLNIKKNQLAPDVHMMDFILSRKDPFGDIAVPVLEPNHSGLELSGALLFHQGKNSGEELDNDQLEMLMMMFGETTPRQKIAGNLFEVDSDKNHHFGFSIKKIDSKINILAKSDRLQKVKIGVRMNINVFEIGETINILSPDKVNKFEKELSKHLEERANATINTLQKANCDLLGFGKEIKAFHPNVWKSLDWRKDFPELTIEPSFDVKIINADNE
jgi:spore germination protein KC